MSANRAKKLAVIGRGMIGSAAARHLSRMGHDVALIGPDEPADFSRHNGVFGSHYDEGRITRRFDPEPFWVQMNCAAISRYDEISAESGEEFYREVGVLHVGPGERSDVASVGKIAAEAGSFVKRMMRQGSRSDFRFWERRRECRAISSHGMPDTSARAAWSGRRRSRRSAPELGSSTNLLWGFRKAVLV